MHTNYLISERDAVGAVVSIVTSYQESLGFRPARLPAGDLRVA